MKAIKLNLNPDEKAHLKKAGVKIGELGNYAVDELGALLNVTENRAKALNAHLIFQRLPSIGPKFAQDLIDMGYFNLEQLKHKDGAELLNEHERFIGYQTDPCVEDQFRLIVHQANSPGSAKQWWDFTAERKAFRAEHGYPANRPGMFGMRRRSINLCKKLLPRMAKMQGDSLTQISMMQKISRCRSK